MNINKRIKSGRYETERIEARKSKGKNYNIGGNNGSATVIIHPNGADNLFNSNCPYQATLGQEVHIVFDATDGWI